MQNSASIATTVPTTGTRFPVDSRTVDPLVLQLSEREPYYSPDPLEVEPDQLITFAWEGSEDPVYVEVTDAAGTPFPLFGGIDTAYPVAAWKGTTYQVASGADGVYYVKRRGATARGTINVKKALK